VQGVSVRSATNNNINEGSMRTELKFLSYWSISFDHLKAVHKLEAGFTMVCDRIPRLWYVTGFCARTG